MAIRINQFRWHEPWCQWLQAYDTEQEFLQSLEKLMSLPTFVPEDVIKQLQVKEEEDIANLTVEQLATKIETYQRAARELHIREYVVRKKLNSKLSSLSDTEVTKLITKVPPAESELRQRRERADKDKAGDRQVRKPSKKQTWDNKLDAMKLTNAAFASFLDGLSPADPNKPK